MLWNFLLEIVCLVSFKISLHNCLPEFHRRMKFVNEKILIAKKKKKKKVNIMFKEHPMYVFSVVN